MPLKTLVFRGFLLFQFYLIYAIIKIHRGKIWGMIVLNLNIDLGY